MEDTGIYIKAVAGISPQDTFNSSSFPATIVQYAGNRMNCIEPDYEDIIDAKLIRRMSRVIKMGTAAAVKCLQNANIEMPGAIVVGTAYGCLQDTETFLQRMTEYNEELLTPTAFIQSTHNTVGAQIALMLQCHNYNNTFVQSGFSFESALLDAMMLLKENEAGNVLAGAADEITDSSHDILSRFGLHKHTGDNSGFFSYENKGTLAGEGAFFFLLSNEASKKNIARLDGVEVFYKPANKNEIEKNIGSFLASRSLSINDIDVIITGKNGDAKNDAVYNALNNPLFSGKQVISYKHFCGEYPTATSFALWLASIIMHEKKLPAALSKEKPASEKEIKRILIYNHYLNKYHSLLLVTEC
jgi:3-oxoacyl-[acyl-carrier-protein] synthase II